MRDNKSSDLIKKRIWNKTKELKMQGVFDGKQIVVFGCTMWMKTLLECINRLGFTVTAIIDNNKQKAGGKCLGIDVYLPCNYLKEQKKEICILICSSYEIEMAQQLESYGYSEGEDYFIISYNNKTDGFIQSFYKIAGGYFLYKKYIGKIQGTNTHIFVCPYGGSGDIYMASLFFDEYLRKHSIDNYIVLVDGKLAQKVAKILEFKNVYLITEKQKLMLLDAWSYLGSDVMRLKPLLYWGWRTKRYPNPDANMDITFLDVMKYDVYGHERSVKPQIKMHRDENYAANYFEENNLEKGNTVIMAPYAGSFKTDISIEIWSEIAKQLIERGYCVCTNSAGEHEPVIEGTKKVFFPLEYAVSILEYAGHFVGIRSGFCDLASSSKCKFVVLYERALNAIKFEYFSFKRMGLNENAIEIEYDSKDSETFVDTILENF